MPLTGSSAVCNFPTGITSGALTYTVSAILKDTNFKSAAATLVQPVAKASTRTQLTSYPPTITASESFNLDVTFKTVAPGTGSPTGHFEWALCPNDISGSDCTPATGTKGGTYVLPTPTSQEMAHNLNKVVIAVPGGLPVGTYYVFTRYIGNSNLGPSTGNEQHVVATPIPTSISSFRAVIRSPTAGSSGSGWASSPARRDRLPGGSQWHGDLRDQGCVGRQAHLRGRFERDHHLDDGGEPGSGQVQDPLGRADLDRLALLGEGDVLGRHQLRGSTGFVNEQVNAP